MQEQRRLTKPQVDGLVGAYGRGTTVRELCNIWQINKDTAYEHLRRAGVDTRRKHKLTADNVERAASLYETGLSLKAVGAHLGVDASTVRNALLTADVAVRPRRGAS